MLKKREKEVKGEEKEIPSELVISPEGISFNSLTKYIPKVEKEGRIRVWRGDDDKFYPFTKVGGELAAAYKMVGFSFIPVFLMERKEGEVEEEEYYVPKKKFVMAPPQRGFAAQELRRRRLGTVIPPFREVNLPPPQRFDGFLENVLRWDNPLPIDEERERGF